MKSKRDKKVKNSDKCPHGVKLIFICPQCDAEQTVKEAGFKVTETPSGGVFKIHAEHEKP